MLSGCYHNDFVDYRLPPQLKILEDQNPNQKQSPNTPLPPLLASLNLNPKPCGSTQKAAHSECCRFNSTMLPGMGDEEVELLDRTRHLEELLAEALRTHTAFGREVDIYTYIHDRCTGLETNQSRQECRVLLATIVYL